MKRKVRVLIKLVREYGFFNTLIYAIFKVIPDVTNLTRARLNLHQDVYDYKTNFNPFYVSTKGSENKDANL